MIPKSKLKELTSWNRKLHIYIGLFLLFFIWLFSLSGLILNHGNWKFTSFWEAREEKKTVTPITLISAPDSATLLQNLMQQLKLTGEVSEVKLTPVNLDFRVASPGIVRDLHIDFQNKTAEQKELRFNFWGKIRSLHTFNGSNKTYPERGPNWMATRVWRLAMDGIALGFIFMCVSSLIMWYKIRKEYMWGTLVLITGFATAIYFVYLLKIL